MMNGVNIASNKRGRPKGQPGRCSICKTEGHNARSCLDSDRVRRKLEVPEVLSVEPPVCELCQSGGHSPSACPRNHAWLPTSSSCMQNTPLSWNTPPSTSTALVPHVPRITSSSEGNYLNVCNTHVGPSALALFPTEAPQPKYRVYDSGINSSPPWSYTPSHGLKEPGVMQRNRGPSIGSPPSTVDQDLSLKSWWTDRSIGGQMGMSIATFREVENPLARTAGGLLSITRHRPQLSDPSPNPEVIRTAKMVPESTFGKPPSAPLERRGQPVALPQQVETGCHHAYMSKMYEQGWPNHDKPSNLSPPGPRTNGAFPPRATSFDSPGSSRQNRYDLAYTAATISLMPAGCVSSSPLEVPSDNHSQCPIVEDAAARRRAQGRIRNPIQRLDLNEPPIESMLDGIGEGPDSSDENHHSPPKLFKPPSPPSPPTPLDDAHPYGDKPASGVTTLQLMSGGKDTPERPLASFQSSRANQWPQQMERYIAKGQAVSRLSPPRLRGGNQKSEGVVLQRDVGSWLMLRAVGEADDVSTALCLGDGLPPGKGRLKILRTESKLQRQRAATVNFSLSPETGSVDDATESNVESLPESVVRGDASASASPASSSAVLPSSGGADQASIVVKNTLFPVKIISTQMDDSNGSRSQPISSSVEGV